MLTIFSVERKGPPSLTVFHQKLVLKLALRFVSNLEGEGGPGTQGEVPRVAPVPSDLRTRLDVRNLELRGETLGGQTMKNWYPKSKGPM